MCLVYSGGRVSGPSRPAAGTVLATRLKSSASRRGASAEGGQEGGRLAELEWVVSWTVPGRGSPDHRTRGASRRLISTQHDGRGKCHSSECQTQPTPLSTRDPGLWELQPRSADHRGCSRGPQGPLPTPWQHLHGSVFVLRKWPSKALTVTADVGVALADWDWPGGMTSG